MDSLILSFASEPQVGIRQLGSSLRGLEEGPEHQEGHGAGCPGESPSGPEPVTR